MTGACGSSNFIARSVTTEAWIHVERDSQVSVALCEVSPVELSVASAAHGEAASTTELNGAAAAMHLVLDSLSAMDEIAARHGVSHPKRRRSHVRGSRAAVRCFPAPLGAMSTTPQKLTKLSPDDSCQHRSSESSVTSTIGHTPVFGDTTVPRWSTSRTSRAGVVEASGAPSGSSSIARLVQGVPGVTAGQWALSK